MECNQTWYSRRDALLEQLSDLLTELQVHDDDSNHSTEGLLDHLDGTRRALDRFAATLTDKFESPVLLDHFSPSVSRPISVSTTTSSTDTSKSSLDSLDSYPSYESSPTTLLSDVAEEQHRQSLLDEDDDDVLIGRRELLDLDDNTEEDGPGHEDADERFERLSMLLTSVLKEAHAAISIPASHDECAIPTIIEDEEELSPVFSDSFSKSSDTLLPTSEQQQPPLIVSTVTPAMLTDICELSPDICFPNLAITKTPYSSLTNRRKMRAPRPSIDTLFVPEVPALPKTINDNDATPMPSPLNIKEAELKVDAISAPPTSSLLDLNLEAMIGDYLSAMSDMHRSDIVGSRFWIVIGLVMLMWCFQWITQGLACQC